MSPCPWACMVPLPTSQPRVFCRRDVRHGGPGRLRAPSCPTAARGRTPAPLDSLLPSVAPFERQRGTGSGTAPARRCRRSYFRFILRAEAGGRPGPPGLHFPRGRLRRPFFAFRRPFPVEKTPPNNCAIACVTSWCTRSRMTVMSDLVRGMRLPPCSARDTRRRRHQQRQAHCAADRRDEMPRNRRRYPAPKRTSSPPRARRPRPGRWACARRRLGCDRLR